MKRKKKPSNLGILLAKRFFSGFANFACDSLNDWNGFELRINVPNK